MALSDGGILSWSLYRDKTLRIWDKNGRSLEVYGLDEGLRLYPEARSAFYGPNYVYGNAHLTAKDKSAILAGHHRPAIVWHGASECRAHLLQAAGRAVVTQANGQVCFLQLCRGNHPISLDELEANVLAEAGSLNASEPPGQRIPETKLPSNK